MILALLFLIASAGAGETPYLKVGDAKVQKTSLYVAPGGEKGVRDTLIADLEFMGIFEILQSAPVTPAEAELSILQDTEGPKVRLMGELRHGLRKQTTEVKGDPKDLKVVAHALANRVVEFFTGQPGIFRTRLVMSCDNGSRHKEIYLSAFDGSEVIKLTDHKSLSISPAWSPEGSQIAYTRYVKHKDNQNNPDLYELDLDHKNTRPLSERAGANGAASYSPDGNSVAFMTRYEGTPAVVVMNRETGALRRVGESLGEETDPSWSPDGKSLAFVSTRSGKPMIYIMNADGTGIRRLTQAGTLNATPAWSPDGQKVAFASWASGRADLYLINADGTNLARLTQGEGDNEDPSFSPDGNFIVFSSTRAGNRGIFVMNADGSFVRRIALGLGQCSAPKWSGLPK